MWKQHFSLCKFFLSIVSWYVLYLAVRSSISQQTQFLHKYCLLHVRLFNGCGKRIENLSQGQLFGITRLGRVFKSHRKTIIDSFSCILFLLQLHLSLNVCYFINFTLKYLTLQSRADRFSSSQWHWCQNIWRKKPGRVHGNSGPVCKKIRSETIWIKNMIAIFQLQNLYITRCSLARKKMKSVWANSVDPGSTQFAILFASFALLYSKTSLFKFRIITITLWVSQFLWYTVAIKSSTQYQLLN